MALATCAQMVLIDFWGLGCNKKVNVLWNSVTFSLFWVMWLEQNAEVFMIISRTLSCYGIACAIWHLFEFRFLLHLRGFHFFIYFLIFISKDLMLVSDLQFGNFFFLDDSVSNSKD